MATYFVTRHGGALEWAARHNIRIDHALSHLRIEEIQPGDVVIGVLPVHLAAEVCAKIRTVHSNCHGPPGAMQGDRTFCRRHGTTWSPARGIPGGTCPMHVADPLVEARPVNHAPSSAASLRFSRISACRAKIFPLAGGTGLWKSATSILRPTTSLLRADCARCFNSSRGTRPGGRNRHTSVSLRRLNGAPSCIGSMR